MRSVLKCWCLLCWINSDLIYLLQKVNPLLFAVCTFVFICSIKSRLWIETNAFLFLSFSFSLGFSKRPGKFKTNTFTITVRRMKLRKGFCHRSKYKCDFCPVEGSRSKQFHMSSRNSWCLLCGCSLVLLSWSLGTYFYVLLIRAGTIMTGFVL